MLKKQRHSVSMKTIPPFSIQMFQLKRIISNNQSNLTTQITQKQNTTTLKKLEVANESASISTPTPVREAVNPTTPHYNPIKKKPTTEIFNTIQSKCNTDSIQKRINSRKIESNESYSSNKYNRTKISIRYSQESKKIKRESDSLEEMSAIKELGLFPDENSMKPVRFCSKPDSNGSA